MKRSTIAAMTFGAMTFGAMTFGAMTIAGVTISALAGPAMAQDVSAGETSFKKCMPCHDIGDGAANKVGPELNGLDGRKAGTADGYPYSDANKNSGITWNEASFKEYIKDPRAKIPGTKMFFPGIKNEQEVDNLWAYLKQFGPDGKPK
jgi:cytochrome c